MSSATNMGDVMQSALLMTLGVHSSGQLFDTSAMYRMVAIMLTGRIVPMITDMARSVLHALFERARARIAARTGALSPVVKRKSASIQFCRRFGDYRCGKNAYDALVWIASQMPQTRFLQCTDEGAMVIANTNPIRIHEDVFLVQGPTVDDKQFARSYVEVYSYDTNLPELRAFCEEQQKRYDAFHCSQLAGKKYLFSEANPIHHHKERLTMNMYPLLTTKTFQNLYGTSVAEAMRRIIKFSKDRDTYATHGVPYTMGILLSGPPGTGKTSLIKAVANYLDRHVVSITLRRDTTREQLNDMFFNEDIQMHSVKHDIKIPIDRRLIILEDADCLDSVVGKRSREQFEHAESVDSDDTVSKTSEPKPKLTMSDILNVLDGVIETPGRVLIITTNHPEKLDEALLRPGRIDVKVELGRFSAADVCEMLAGFFDNAPSLDAVRAAIPDGKWTAAEVSNAILASGDDVDAAMKRLSA